MLKTTFFKSHAILVLLLPIVLLGVVFLPLLLSAIHSLENSDIEPLQYFASLLLLLEVPWFMLTVLSSLSFIGLMAWNLMDRLMTDSLWNFFVSLHETRAFRFWLKKEEYTSQEMTDFNLSDLPVGKRTIRIFNKVVSSSIIDVECGRISVYLKRPPTAETEQLLNKMYNQIQSYLADEFPDYFFSAVIKDKKWVMFKGQRNLE